TDFRINAQRKALLLTRVAILQAPELGAARPDFDIQAALISSFVCTAAWLEIAKLNIGKWHDPSSRIVLLGPGRRLAKSPTARGGTARWGHRQKWEHCAPTGAPNTGRIA